MFCLNFWYFIYSMIDGLDNWRQYSCDQLNFIVYWDLIFLFGPLSDTVFSIDLLLNFFFQGWVDISLVTSLTERSHHYLIRLSSSLTVRRWSSLSCNSSDLFWYSNSWIGSFKFQFNFSSSGIRLTSQWSGKNSWEYDFFLASIRTQQFMYFTRYFPPFIESPCPCLLFKFGHRGIVFIHLQQWFLSLL